MAYTQTHKRDKALSKRISQTTRRLKRKTGRGNFEQENTKEKERGEAIEPINFARRGNNSTKKKKTDNFKITGKYFHKERQ